MKNVIGMEMRNESSQQNNKENEDMQEIRWYIAGFTVPLAKWEKEELKGKTGIM